MGRERIGEIPLKASSRYRKNKRDPAVQSELEREERQFRERRAEERRNSKRLTMMVPAPIYLTLLKICDKYGREIPSQAIICFEAGVKYYDNAMRPYGESRPLDMLPEIRMGDVLEPERPTVAQIRRPAPESAGWLGQDAGMPEQPYKPWQPDPPPTAAVEPIVEPEPEPEPQPPAEEEVEVEV